MKNAITFLILMLELTQVFAQAKTDQAAGVTPSPLRSSRTAMHKQASAQSMLAYGSFALAGEERFGPMVLIQYMPNQNATPALAFFGGVLFRAGTSDPVDQSEYIPLASRFAYPYPPYSQYGDPYFERPSVSIGLAFLGADLTWYLAEGDARPYVGVGASFAFWSYFNRFSGTLAPSAKAGLDVHISSSFSAFAEVRRMFGVPNFVGPLTPKFDGLTAVAVGLSFVPKSW